MATLAEIRAKLAQQDNKNVSNSVDNSVYAHWNIPENTTTTIRFVPDGNANNTFFWVEKAMIRLPFNGIVNQPNSRAQIVQVPCVEMWGEKCPVLNEVRTWFKDKGMEEMGRKYWKKKSYLFQGFVVDPGAYKEDSLPENPLRRFIISPQLFNLIKAALMDPDMQDLPTDYLRGTDFRITKTTKGQYADYNTSSWARRERALSEAELSAIEKYGLSDLSTFLPKKPNDVELKIIQEMFEASVNGEAYDPARWGQHYKPSGFAANSDVDSLGSATAPAVARVQKVQSTVVEDDVPFEVSKPVVTAPAAAAPVTTTSKRAEDILAALKARQNKS